MKFKVGDWVLLNRKNKKGVEFEYTSEMEGKILVGKVIDVVGFSTLILLGIEFTEYVDGHSCEGKGKGGYCWYVNSKKCKKLSKKEAMLHIL